MKTVIRDLLPYGIVIRLAAKRQAIREAARMRERSAMLRQPGNPAVPLNGERLNMGCGTHYEPGWINADGADGAPLRILLREGEPLQFEDGSLEVIFSEHFLEHITVLEAQWFLRESYRALKPGGLFRVSCPDLEVIARALTEPATFQAMRHVYGAVGDGDFSDPEDVVNHAFYGHGHRHLWTFSHLGRELTKAGFTDVRRVPFGVSRIDGAAIEIRQGEAFMSLIVEASRP